MYQFWTFGFVSQWNHICQHQHFPHLSITTAALYSVVTQCMEDNSVKTTQFWSYSSIVIFDWIPRPNITEHHPNSQKCSCPTPTLFSGRCANPDLTVWACYKSVVIDMTTLIIEWQCVPLYMAGIYQFGYFKLILAFFFNFEGWFRGLFQMYDLNGVYHEKADVRGIPKMW